MRYLIKFLLQFLTVFAVFICATLLDILLAAAGEVFAVYSYALFIVIFAVAGILAAAFTLSPPDYFKKNTVPLWVALFYDIIIAAVYYFPFAREGGEYQPAFRSLGVMPALAAVFFYWMFRKDEKAGGYK